MVKRHCDGAVVAACATACLDVLPSQLHRAADQPVLGSIENLPAARHESSHFASNKKQCRLGADQGPKPFDASSLFAKARSVLRQPSSTVQGAPIGREQEFEKLAESFEQFSSSKAGSSIYVSGLPGTGKSHTVRNTLTHFLSSNSAQPKCLVTWINCMSVSGAGQIYAQVASTARAGHSSDWQQHHHHHHQHAPSDAAIQLPFGEQPQQQQPQSMSFEALLDVLQQHHQRQFAGPDSKASSNRGAKRYKATRARSAAEAQTPSKANATSSSGSQSQQPLPHILVLDEIDNIAKKSLSDLVQLFKLPHEPGVAVLVLGIANSIDLTERTLPELRLQLVTPRLITFNAYSAKQLGAILDSLLQQLPTKLFSSSALQLCCRSVGASSGDLRHALKACRAAIHELEQQHQQQQEAAATTALLDSCDGAVAAAAVAPAVLSIGPKQMSIALGRLAGVRSAQFGAQAASIIRSLPNQQQMLLYSLAVFCQQPADDAAAGGQDPATPSKGGKAATSSLWKGAGSAAVLSSGAPGGGSPAGGPGSWSGLKKKKKVVAGSSSQAGAQASVFALAVTADAAHQQYMQVCKLLKLPACPKTELLHMADLLAQMALLDVIKIKTPPSGSSGTCNQAGLKAGGSSAGALKGFKGSASKLGGLGGGGRGLLGGASRGWVGGLGGSPLGSAAGAGQQWDVKLSLRASSSEVFAALKHNPALRCLLDA